MEVLCFRLQYSDAARIYIGLCSYNGCLAAYANFKLQTFDTIDFELLMPCISAQRPTVWTVSSMLLVETDIPGDREIVGAFKSVLLHYLKGKGHPGMARALVSAESVDAESEDPDLRARLLFSAATGLSQLSLDVRRIKVCYHSPLPVSAQCLPFPQAQTHAKPALLNPPRT